MKIEELREAYVNRIDELRKRIEKPNRLVADKDRTTVDGVFTGTLNIVTALFGSGAPQIKALMEMHKLSNTRGYNTDWLISSFGQSLMGV